MSNTALVVHGHFYQPPRENPWTGLVDPQPGAAPFHDWNERVHAECYRPNGWARVFDGRGRVGDIVNNYELISYNVGPSLLMWLEGAHPDTYRRIVEADEGHRAMAQAWGHAILPLACPRDRLTQIRWGLADFAHRFDRPARGMWLPEAAADEATLDDLAAEGVAFTVLAPDQALGAVKPGVPYRWKDTSLTLLFYDGPLARAVAFEKAISTSELFMERIERAASDGRPLVHLATDGETYGHHVPYGDRSLAFALTRLAPDRGFEVTSYQHFLEENPPVEAADIVSPSSWSCAHGVGRWERDCGCSTGGEPGWNQRWRGPLRAALDVVRDRAAAVYEAEAAALLNDPWAARDDYIAVLLGRITPLDFADAAAARPLHRRDRVDVLNLLEMQRNALLMYTSCGWFFNDLAGIETTQVLAYASRCLRIMEEFGESSARPLFLDALADASSNRRSEGNGTVVFARRVEPAAAPGARIAAHLALMFIANAPPPGGRVGTWQVKQWSPRRESHGRLALATGRVEVESLLTSARLDYACVALYLGGIDFWVSLVPYTGEDDLDLAAGPLWAAFPGAPLPHLLRLAAECFPGEEFGLEAALPDGVQAIIETVFSDLVERFASQYGRLYDDHTRILALLAATGFQMPRELAAAAEFTLSRRLEDEVRSLGERFDRDAFARAAELAREAQQAGVSLHTETVSRIVSEALTRSAVDAARERTPASVSSALSLLDLTAELGVAVDVERAQEAVFAALPNPVLTDLGRRLGLTAPG